MGGISIGLLAGGQAAEVMLLVNTQKALDSMLSNKVKLGAGVAMAVGPKGAGQARRSPPTSFRIRGPRALMPAWHSTAR